MGTYSANEELRTLCQKLGFDVQFFDDPELGSQILLRDARMKGEVDAIDFFQNLVLLVGINSGSGESVESERRKFLDNLQHISSVSDMSLSINAAFSKEEKKANKPRVDAAQERLDAVLNQVMSLQAKGFEPIVRRLFFCPGRKIERAINSRPGELTIDKDAFDYFRIVSERLDRDYLRRDFFYFASVKKGDLERKSPSKSGTRPKSGGFDVIRVPIEADKIIAYPLSLRVEDLQEYVTVLRLSQKYDKRGFQRMVDGDRLRKINAGYLAKNETFPNNIIIALNPEVYSSEQMFFTSTGSGGQGQLAFSNEFNSLVMIDGQHRFFSLYMGKKTDRVIFATFLFFKSESLDDRFLQMYKMFYEINKNQVKIDPNLSFVLKARIEPGSLEAFWYDVFTRLDRGGGFFKDRYSFREGNMREEGMQSIFSVVQYGGILGLAGDLRRKGRSYPGLESIYAKTPVSRIDFAHNLIRNYFELVERVLSKQRISKDRLAPRDVGGLLRLIRHAIYQSNTNVKLLGEMDNVKSPSNQEQSTAIRYFEDSISLIPFAKLLNLKLGSSGWPTVEGYTIAKVRKKGSKFGVPGLLSKRGREVYDEVRRGTFSQ